MQFCFILFWSVSTSVFLMNTLLSMSALKFKSVLSYEMLLPSCVHDTVTQKPLV